MGGLLQSPKRYPANDCGLTPASSFCGSIRCGEQDCCQGEAAGGLATVGIQWKLAVKHIVHPDRTPVAPPSSCQFVTDRVQNTPPTANLPLALIPFQADNGMGSSRKRLRLEPSVVTFNLNLCSDSQTEPIHPPKRLFRTEEPLPGWNGAGPSHIHSQVDSEFCIRDSLTASSNRATSGGNSPLCSPWDLTPVNIPDHEEVGVTHLQHAWTSF